MDKITHEMRIWCQQNCIDEKQFYYWQRRIRNQVFELQMAYGSTYTVNHECVTSPRLVNNIDK
jgi:NAD-dependent DNA ligase